MTSLFKKISASILSAALLLGICESAHHNAATRLYADEQAQADAAQSELTPEALRPEYSDHKIKALKATIGYFNALFLTRYGPIRWKQMQWKWNPEAESQIALQEIKELEDTKIDSIKPIFNRLLSSTRDGHVSISYSDNRLAVLPIKATWIDSRIIVTRSSLSAIKVGDEIISIDDQPILDYISNSLYGCDWEKAPLARPEDDMWRVFARLGLCDSMPKNLEGVVKIHARRNDKDIKAFAIWEFVESISDSDLTDLMQLQKPSALPIHRALLAKHISPNHHIQKLIETRTSSHSSDRDYLTADPSTPHWYIRKISGTPIGYFRLPDFSSERVIETLDEAIGELMDSSEALLIDLRNNGGGYDLVCQAVLSRLIDRPLVNVLESSLLDIHLVNQGLETAEYYEQLLLNTSNDKELHTIIGDDNLLGYYITREVIKDWMLYYRACSEDWATEHTCTRFVPNNGQSLIQPHPHQRYTKPIYLLIDERAGSCGDMFPAILRDNERATLLGRTTAGLGGAYEAYEIPNFTGIEKFSLTHSLLLRTNQQVIEDLGVEPHYLYKKTLDDVLKPRSETDRAFAFIAQQLKEQPSDPIDEQPTDPIEE